MDVIRTRTRIAAVITDDNFQATFPCMADQMIVSVKFYALTSNAQPVFLGADESNGGLQLPLQSQQPLVIKVESPYIITDQFKFFSTAKNQVAILFIRQIVTNQQ